LAIGLITEVEPDGRMCNVKWQSEEEEWLCSGFNGKHYLQAFIVQKDKGTASSVLRDAILAPQWVHSSKDGVWKMNRMRSNLRVNMGQVIKEAREENLLGQVRSLVAKHFQMVRSEQSKAEEEQKLMRKLQRRQERGGKGYLKNQSAGSLEPDTNIDVVAFVGDFLRKHQSMSQIVHTGRMAELSRNLRNAFNDMEKLPNGNIVPDEIILAVGKMQLGISSAELREIIKQHDPENHHEFNCEEYLNMMYSVIPKATLAPKMKRKGSKMDLGLGKDRGISRTPSGSAMSKESGESVTPTKQAATAAGSALSRLSSSRANRLGSLSSLPPNTVARLGSDRPRFLSDSDEPGKKSRSPEILSMPESASRASGSSVASTPTGFGREYATVAFV